MIVDGFVCRETENGVLLRGLGYENLRNYRARVTRNSYLFERCSVCLLLEATEECENDRTHDVETGVRQFGPEIPDKARRFLKLRAGLIHDGMRGRFHPRIKLFVSPWILSHRVITSPSGRIHFEVPLWAEGISYWIFEFINRFAFVGCSRTCLLWDPRTWGEIWGG